MLLFIILSIIFVNSPNDCYEPYKYDKYDIFWIVKTDEIVIKNNYRWSGEIKPMLILGQKLWFKAYKIEKWKKNKYKNNGKPFIYDIDYEEIENSYFIKDDIGNGFYY